MMAWRSRFFVGFSISRFISLKILLMLKRFKGMTHLHSFSLRQTSIVIHLLRSHRFIFVCLLIRNCRFILNLLRNRLLRNRLLIVLIIVVFHWWIAWIVTIHLGFWFLITLLTGLRWLGVFDLRLWELQRRSFCLRIPSLLIVLLSKHGRWRRGWRVNRIDDLKRLPWLVKLHHLSWRQLNLLIVNFTCFRATNSDGWIWWNLRYSFRRKRW